MLSDMVLTKGQGEVQRHWSKLVSAGKRSERRFHGDLKLRKCGERLAGAHRGGCVGNIMVKEEKDVMHGAIAGPLLIASLLQLHYGTGIIEQEPCIGAAVPVTLRNKAERENGWPDM